jgi:arylsulfatase A-like enzyme
MDVLLGRSSQGRDELVLEATSRTALRKGNWVLIPPYEGPAINTQVNIELGNSDEYQLYDLGTDTGQQHNLAGSHREKLEEMIAAYERIRGAADSDIEQLELK